MPGPIPKRSEERRRRNKPEVDIIKVNLDEALAGTVEIPAPPTRVNEKTGEIKSLWHPTAEQAYLSLARSGQCIWYEPSDWAFAYALCESLSRELNPKPVTVTSEDGSVAIEWVTSPVNGAVLGQFLKGWSVLMATEGDRRRLKIELERKKAQDAILAGDGKVASITQNREDLFR